MARKIHYDNWSKEELIKELRHIKEIKYGLVWHRDLPEEKIDILINPDARTPNEMFPNEMAGRPFPVLKEAKSKDVNSSEGKPINLLIEGDNYHSLAVLNFTHQEAIDLIYIDPPYNTGNKDFIYNDKFVDKEDPFRHSKWLSFIEKRLKLAKNLLKSTGVILVSIDDHEQAPLKMLCDEIFGEENFIVNMPRRTKSAGKTTETISLNHDYVLVYAKDRQIVKFNAISIDDRAYKYKDKYCSERGPYALSQTLDYDSLSYSDSLDYELKLDEHIYYPGGDKKAFLVRKTGKHRASDWTWRWGKELVDFGNKNDFIVIKKGKNGQPRIYTKTYFKVVIEKINGKYQIVPVDRAKNLSTLDLMESTYSNDISKKDIRAVFGAEAEFAYPKPLSLIKYLINSIPNHDNLTVLDFFAGSGTTGQAVIELNKSDGGNRQFILCTNNENNICTDVCYPRLKKVIKGYKNGEGKNIAGLGGNLKYYTCDFVEAEPTDRNKRKLVNESTEMLCIKENAFELVEDKGDFKIYKNSNKYLGIVFYEEAIDDFKKAIKKIKGHFNVYVFSLGDDPHEKQFTDVRSRVTLCAIPEVILKVYREIFK